MKNLRKIIEEIKILIESPIESPNKVIIINIYIYIYNLTNNQKFIKKIKIKNF